MRFGTLFSILLLSAAGISCNDSLPAYVAPTDFLRASIRITTPPDANYTWDWRGNDINVDAVTITSSAQTFFIDIVSTFDETLQDVPDISGAVVVTSEEISGVTATIPLTITNLKGTQYNPTTKILTLNPGDTLKMSCTWRYKSDDGKWVFSKADVAGDSEVSPIPPMRGSFERTHVPMNFSVTGRVKLFTATNNFDAPKQELKLIFHGHIILPP